MLADMLPAICGSDTFTTVVSSTSMKVASMTEMAIIQGLTCFTERLLPVYRGGGYTANVALHRVELEDTEIKLLLVAIRQVQHTFVIAESQSTAAGEPLADDYEGVREAYGR